MTTTRFLGVSMIAALACGSAGGCAVADDPAALESALTLTTVITTITGAVSGPRPSPSM